MVKKHIKSPKLRIPYDGAAMSTDSVDCSKYHCRIDMATDGTVAILTLSDEQLYVWDSHGKQLGTKSVHAGGHHFGDVAIDPQHKTVRSCN